MPKENETFILDQTFTDAQMEVLRKGYIPESMDDRWFWYMHRDTMYIYRSWTGYCIYIIQFSEEGKHKVTVNRDTSQYRANDVEREAINLRSLLGSFLDHNKE